MRRMKPTVRGALLATMALVGCASTPAADTVGDGPSVHQFVQEVQLESGGPLLLLVAVDDGPGPDAIELRRRWIEGLPGALRWLSTRSYADGDPAAWRPLDLRVFVVHPSTSGAAAFVGPTDDPRLALTTVKATDADVAQLADDVAGEIRDDTSSSAPSAPYQLLDATDRAYRLLMRQRPPDDSREARLVASMPPAWNRIWVSVASSRDDDSPLAPDGYVIPPLARSFSRGSELALIEDCSHAPGTRPRLDRWAAARRAEILPWACDDPAPEDPNQAYPLVSEWFADGGCFSPSRPVSRDAAGNAACSISFSAEGISTCDASRGWLDPRDTRGLRRPRVDDMHQRVCEIGQLHDAALQSCRSSVGCEGCGSGFCFDDLPRPPGACAGPNLRLVGGARPAGIGRVRLTITCDLVP